MRALQQNHPAQPQRRVTTDEAAPADEPERRVLVLLAQKGRLVRRDAQKALGVSQATAALLLRGMEEKGRFVSFPRVTRNIRELALPLPVLYATAYVEVG